MIAALLLAAGGPVFPKPVPMTIAPLGAPVAPLTAQATLAPDDVVARYAAALATLKEPRVFVVEYTLEQTGPRTLDQTHRIFRNGGDERDETLAVNGNRSTTPVVRIFRGRPYRYTVAALAPRTSAYIFTFAGRHRDGKHVDYVFDLTPKAGTVPAFTFTQVTIDGITFLPQSVSFVETRHDGRGAITFAKSEKYWVARSASAQANVPGGAAHEQVTFSHWRFPTSLPRSTFAMPRALPTAPPALP